MQDVFIFTGVAAAIALFVIAYRLYIRWKKPEHEIAAFRTTQQQHQPVNRKPPTGAASTAACPVCSTPLAHGENLVSKVFRELKSDSPQEQRCTILGCPHCYPVCKQGVRRFCPVCKKNLPSDGWLNAKLYSRTIGKNHVRITGCTECHKKP